MTLNTRAWFGFLFLALVVGGILFGGAGAFQYWQAWIYLAAFFGSCALITIYLMQHDPALLERRVNAGPVAETKTSQQVIQSFAALAFIALLSISAIDHRLAWSSVPLLATVLGDLLVLAGLYFVFRVFRENTFTSATIEVARDQKVISTGPYAFVRHPMYAGALLYLVGTPLALGSYWGLIALVAMVPVLILRSLDEERFLAKDLPGYAAYTSKVKYRLVPGVF